MFRLRDAAVTDVGVSRKINEDSVHADPALAIWAVADGVGGHQRGDWASQQIVAALAEIRLGTDLEENSELIADALELANTRIYEAAVQGETIIASTVVVVHVLHDRFVCLWAGDSRLYLARREGMRQISRDHSQIEELIAAGVLERAAARHHPLANTVTRAIGVTPELSVDVITGSLQDNDRLVLCSDGLNRCVPDEEIARIVDASSSADACRALVGLCLDRGAPDNVSIVVIACELTTRLSIAPLAG